MTCPADSTPSRRVTGSGEAALVALVYALVTVIVTWPQAAVITTHTHGHHDALFSMWRLSWIAQALGTVPSQLFDAPIFWPVTGTLGFSDAVLLQGVVAWPLLAAGLPVLPVYNVLLLAGPFTSAVGAYVLTRRLTGSRGGAMLAGLVFGFAPYRLEHAMHLELQWSQWMPLTMWALHRTWTSGRVTDGALTGVCVLLQFLSCIYYGVFLALFLVLVAPVLWWWQRPARPVQVVMALAVGALLIAPALVAYAMPYRANQTQLGVRGADEIAQWSATPASYAATPRENRLYGWTSELGTPEARLFPGALALVLAGMALWRPRPLVVVYAWGLVCAVVMSFGTHTPVYAMALDVVPPLEGLRAPARFAMLATLALAVLAGFGWARLVQGRSRRMAAATGVLGVVVMTAEYATAFGPLHAWPQRPPMYANWLATQPAGVVLDLPVPVGHALPLFEAEWSYLGTFHWHPMVNGYSGYYPRPYLDLLGALHGFPSGESIWALGKRDVRYVVLHEDRYDQAVFLDLVGRIEQYPCLERVGRFPDRAYPASVYILRQGC